MTSRRPTIFITGASGQIGRGVLHRLLGADPAVQCVVLARDVSAWRAGAQDVPASRVSPVRGDLLLPRLGLDQPTLRQLAGRVTHVLHLAADTEFSRPLEVAREINVRGTARLLEIATGWAELRGFVHVSTAFVAGRRTGPIPEAAAMHGPGWVNAYEQSKAEGEELVRASSLPWSILRPSTIVCDDISGRVSRRIVVHRALRVLHHGLASMLPGDESGTIDVITRDYACEAIARLAMHRGLENRTLHLCAGAAALPLGELLDITFDFWAETPEWKRRAIDRPALTDLATYALFEQSIEETGDRRLRGIAASLSHFVPQLALSKQFDTSGADTLLGAPAPSVRSYWVRMLEYLLASWEQPAARLRYRKEVAA